MIELLAPAGNMEKLKTAIYFGADAVYLSGQNYGLRAFADNFDTAELTVATEFVHKMGKKLYVTINIFAHNRDFDGLKEYVQFLQSIAVDGVIVSDSGIIAFVKKYAPKLPIHLSTQANTTNKYSAEFWVAQGVERIVLARELSFDEIKEIRDYLPREVMLEAFVHGAMCMAYSGRCLLSNYLTGRGSNQGQCAQSCRWEYFLKEKTRDDVMTIEEDERGSYILNSKDLNMIQYIDKLASVGVESFKIEGRVKSPYYVANVVNAYRKAIKGYNASPNYFVTPEELVFDLNKSSHRQYCTGFYFGRGANECYETSKPKQEYDFMAIVDSSAIDGKAVIEQRNRFKVGDKLEVLSPNAYHNSVITVGDMYSEQGELIFDALNVQQKIILATDIPLCKGDILHKKAN